MTMLQIRNLPDDLHRALKIRAAEEGVSMSDWVKAVIEQALARPSRAEILARIAALPPVQADPTALLRQERGPLLAAEPAVQGWPSSDDDRS